VALTRYPDTSQVDGEARGPAVGFGAGASADLNPLHDCLLLRPAVVQLPSVFHRVTPAAVVASTANNSNGNETDAMPTSGSPSLSRKTRTIVSGGASAPSPTNSPYQSPKMKARNCHHHQQQQQQQQPNHSSKQTINGETESPSPSPYHHQQHPHPNPRHQLSLMQQRVRTIVPKLTNDMQKGQCGRIGVFGGCIM
jgi:hypothetical protein